MNRVEYRRPVNVGDALALLSHYDGDAKVLAGGQSLVPMMTAGLLSPAALVDVNRVEGLNVVAWSEETLHIGALARHCHFTRQAECRAPLLHPAARLVGHAAVRNRGTVVGSVVHADPAGEWPAVAIALDAQVRLVGPRGERTVGVAEFIEGPLTSAIAPDELALELLIPASPPSTGAAVEELAYRHGDYAIVGVAAQLTVDEGDQVLDARLALFGVDAVAVRAHEAERALLDGGLDAIEDAAQLAQGSANPNSDATASADYRRAMIPPFCVRALRRACAEARAA